MLSPEESLKSPPVRGRGGGTKIHPRIRGRGRGGGGVDIGELHLRLYAPWLRDPRFFKPEERKKIIREEEQRLGSATKDYNAVIEAEIYTPFEARRF